MTPLVLAEGKNGKMRWKIQFRLTLVRQNERDPLADRLKSSYVYPVRMFSSEDFPAPEGPIIAVSSPELNFPDTPFRTVFLSGKRRQTRKK